MVANNDDQNPTKRARQGAASGAQPSGQAADSKRVAASGAQPATASGEMHGAASGAKADKYVPFVDLIGLQSGEAGSLCLKAWAEEKKIFVDRELIPYLIKHKALGGKAVPNSVMLIPPWAISKSAPNSPLSSFREVMNHGNLKASLARTGQYEAAGTVWMMDAASGADTVMVSQLEHSMRMWEDSAFHMSSQEASTRRFSFDVPLPAQVIDVAVAQRTGDDGGVLFAHTVPMLAGHAIVMTWYGAMAAALAASNTFKVVKLFEAAVSVPIRLRICADEDSACLARLLFAENMFTAAAAAGAESFWLFAEKVCSLSAFTQSVAANASVRSLHEEIKKYHITFRGKALGESIVKSVKALHPFLSDAGCRHAYALAEGVVNELRDQTMLLRIAQLCGGRSAEPLARAPQEAMIFIIESLKAGRLSGDYRREDCLTLSQVVGTDKKVPAIAHNLFKKKEFCEFVLHELELLDTPGMGKLEKFRSPLMIVRNFSASGEAVLADSFRQCTSFQGPDTMETAYASAIAKHRDDQGSKQKAAIDVLWGLWSGLFDDEISELAAQELQGHTGAFLWHRYCNDSNKELGSKYRAMVAAYSAGPIASGEAAASGADIVAVLGTSELGDAEKEELSQLQQSLKRMRRKTVTFTALPVVGGASGPDFTPAQLTKMWEESRLGHKYTQKTGNIRAFVLAADLFPPNVAKRGADAKLNDPMAVDGDRMKRVIDFIAQKRTKDDIVLLLDGRSRACRRVFELAEEKLSASGGHSVVECWYVYMTPKKTEDPRVSARNCLFSLNNKETAISSLLKGRTKKKVTSRAEFNSCGESSTGSTTYTGVPMRRFSELPRMDYETKVAIVGAAASGAVTCKRMQKDIETYGHPFSHAETKPLNLWQRIMEHHQVTHVMDFSPGSGALAIAASGAIEYDGIAANVAHRNWLDSTLDRCAMYLAGQDEKFARGLGGDDEFVKKAQRYLGGTMLEVKRMLEPSTEAHCSDDEDSSDDNNEPGA